MTIVDQVKRCGVVGAGGAGFPTHLKLGSKVDTVIVNGKIVMEDRRFPWDTARVFEEARTAARRLWRDIDGIA